MVKGIYKYFQKNNSCFLIKIRYFSLLFLTKHFLILKKLKLFFLKKKTSKKKKYLKTDFFLKKTPL